MIKIKNVWKRYNGNPVLKGINLTIEKGETLAILGRSGAGKSVLLRLIIGLEKPDQGEILINGIDIVPLEGEALLYALRDVGMLFQASALFDSMTIEENTGFYLSEHRLLPPHEIKDRITHSLEMVGLQGTEALFPSDLSGGMKKRAALARLIAYRPKILLYDEPTTGLDPLTAAQIDDLIVKTRDNLNATGVVVTHDIRSAFRVANKIALNHEGKIAYNEEKEEFAKIKDPLVSAFIKL